MPFQNRADQTHNSEPFDMEYWQTKFALLKLGAAIRNVQPRVAIMRLADEINDACTRLLQRYPLHQPLHSWRDQIQAIRLHDEHDLHNRDHFSERLYWNHPEFEAGWVHYHMAITAALRNELSGIAHHTTLASHHLLQALAEPLRCPRKIRRWLHQALANTATLALNRVA